MAKPKAPKVIKCFGNSKENKVKREQEIAMANAMRTYRHFNAQDERDVIIRSPRQMQQMQQRQQQQQRGRSMQQRPQYQDYQYKPPSSSAFQKPTKNVYVHRPDPPVVVQHPQQPQQPIHYLLDFQKQMNSLSGLGQMGRSKSVPPELRQHFAGYNMYGDEKEEEKIMEFSTDNSIASKRSLTKGIVTDKQRQQREQEQQRARQLQQQLEQQRLSQQNLKRFQEQERLRKQQHEEQKEEQERLAEQKLQLFQARIRDIQNNMQKPPVPQISIEQPSAPAVTSAPPPPIKHQLPSQQKQRSKTPEPDRQSLLQKINPRSKTPEPQRSSTPASATPTTIIRTERYHAEKIVTAEGHIMLKKKIVHVNRTRSCAACGFRQWSEDDMAFLLVRQSKNNDSETTSTTQQQQVKWLCPDCACDNGLPKEHYHWNKNRLAPVPDPVTQITMNQPLGQIEPEDLEWVHRAQRRPKPMNWKSQYSDYYKNIRQKQRQKQAVCCGPPPAPEDYSDDPEDDIRRVIANACYAPNYESSEVGETCYSYVGDL